MFPLKESCGSNMFVKGSITLSKGFQTWKSMVQANEEKMRQIGFRMVYAGTPADDESQLTVIMEFDSPEAYQN